MNVVMDVGGFQELRTYLFSVAYRMLGRATEAEDIIQDAWVRYQTASPTKIESLKAYLTTIVTRTARFASPQPLHWGVPVARIVAVPGARAVTSHWL